MKVPVVERLEETVEVDSVGGKCVHISYGAHNMQWISQVNMFSEAGCFINSGSPMKSTVCWYYLICQHCIIYILHYLYLSLGVWFTMPIFRLVGTIQRWSRELHQETSTDESGRDKEFKVKPFGVESRPHSVSAALDETACHAYGQSWLAIRV